MRRRGGDEMKPLVLAVMTMTTVLVLVYISDALHYERWNEVYQGIALWLAVMVPCALILYRLRQDRNRVPAPRDSEKGGEGQP
jgi:uncharacterized membrane protein